VNLTELQDNVVACHGGIMDSKKSKNYSGGVTCSPLIQKFVWYRRQTRQTNDNAISRRLVCCAEF